MKNLDAALILLAAVASGSGALILAGLDLRARGALGAALARVRPLAGTAWRFILLALPAAFVADQPVRDLLILGGVAAMAVFGLAAALRPDRGERPAAAVALAGALGLAALWGDRYAPADGIGRAFPFAVAASLLLGASFLGLVPPRWRMVAPLGTAALGSLAAYGVSTRLLGAFDLWHPAAAGCALAAGVALILAVATRPDAEPPPWLCFATVLVAGGAGMLVVGRLYGMFGVSCAALGFLALAPFQAAAAARLSALLAALYAGRAALQWALEVAGLGPAGLDLTRPMAFAALTAGVALAAVPPLAAPYLRRPAAGSLLAAVLAALVPAVAVVALPDALPALVAGLLAAVLVGGASRTDPGTSTLPALLTCIGAASALTAHLMADVALIPAAWRAGTLLAALAAVGIAAAAAAAPVPAEESDAAGPGAGATRAGSR